MMDKAPAFQNGQNELKGATYGPNIRRWMDTTRQADLGQCFIAVDPDCFAPGFQTRMSDLMSHLRHMEPVISTNPRQVFSPVF